MRNYIQSNWPVLSILFVFTATFGLLVTLPHTDRWNLDTISDFLNVPLPTSTENIEYSGYTGRGGWFDLTFETPVDSADEFISNFCGGELLIGYDPFDSVDSKEKLQDYFHIVMEFSLLNNPSHYSYSPNTTEDILGMRCYVNGKGQFQISVDTSNKVSHLVRIEYSSMCTKCIVEE